MNIKIETLPFACFSTKLEVIDLDSIQEALLIGYRTQLADPKYIFVSGQDFEIIETIMNNVSRGSVNMLLHPSGYQRGHLSIKSEITGTHIHVIPLPDMEFGTLVFGFFMETTNGI